MQEEPSILTAVHGPVATDTPDAGKIMQEKTEGAGLDRTWKKKLIAVGKEMVRYMFIAVVCFLSGAMSHSVLGLVDPEVLLPAAVRTRNRPLTEYLITVVLAFGIIGLTSLVLSPRETTARRCPAKWLSLAVTVVLLVVLYVWEGRAKMVM